VKHLPFYGDAVDDSRDLRIFLRLLSNWIEKSNSLVSRNLEKIKSHFLVSRKDRPALAFPRPQFPTLRERMEACHGIANRSRPSTMANRAIAMIEIITKTAKTSAVSICPLAEVRR